MHNRFAQRTATAVYIRRICAIAALIVFLAASLGCSAGIAAESKRVMLLHSFGSDFKPWSEYAKSIRTELKQQSPWPLDITEHSLVTARSPDEDPEVPFVEYLRALFAKRPLDLIVSIGAPAAAFVQRHRQRLFAATPMVFTAVDQRRVQYSSLTANDAVVALRIDYLSAFENILQVLPDTKNVIVVVGTSPIEKFWKEAIGKEVEPLANRIKLSWTDELSFEALLKQASALPPHTAIFWELMIVDAAGVVHEGDVPLTRLHAVATAPIFSYDESFFGNAIVGGPLLLAADTGRQTAAVAIRILNGEKPDEIRAPVVQFASPVFDWREMQRWGISESRLPPGSEILFRSPTAWEQYRTYILAFIAAILIQSALISWLLYEHWRRQRAEILARNTLSELTQVNRMATVGQLSASIAHEIRQPLA
ncbi:MAG: ATPase, partial [Pseudolabrys sp.]